MVTTLGNVADEIALGEVLDRDDGACHEEEASGPIKKSVPGT
jgi:hypothetical protein